MSPEEWVAVAAVFMSGGALGTAGTLLAQWVVRRIAPPPAPPGAASQNEFVMLREDVGRIARHLRAVDQRLDLTEQLLGGSNLDPHAIEAPQAPDVRLPPADDADPGDESTGADASGSANGGTAPSGS